MAIPAFAVHTPVPRELLAKVSRRLVWESYITKAQLRLKLWDSLASPQARRRMEDACLLARDLPPVLGDDPILRDPQIDPKSLFTPVFVKPSREYVFRVEQPVMMEPDYGYLIAPPSHLLYESVPLSEQIRSRKTIAYCSALPSLGKYLAARAGRAPVRRERAIASMRFVFEPNYYHFLQDTLTRLALLDRYGAPEDVTLVVSRQLANAGFFDQIRKRGKLAQRRWLVQDEFFIEADEAFVVRTGEGNRAHLEHLMDLMEVPAPDPERQRRIFLTRDIALRGRGIRNMSEVEPVLAEFGIEVVDTDKLSFDEQIALFNEASLVIGVHGAGLANVIFRRGAKLDLIELFSPLETPLYFYILARAFGYGHGFLKGFEPDGSGPRANFKVDPDALRAALHSRLAS